MRLILAIKELRRSRRQILTLFFILWIGYIGPLLAASLRSSTTEFLRSKARDMLSADLALTSLRPFTDAEVTEATRVLQAARTARELEFISMASAPATAAVASPGAPTIVSTLVEVHAIDDVYPIYGQFRVRTASDVAKGEPHPTHELVANEHSVWVGPEVLLQLGLTIGQTLRLGDAEFTVTGEVLDAPGALRSGLGLAPRIFISRAAVPATGLAQYGSQVSHRVYFALPANADPAIAASLAKAALPDPDIFLRTPDDSIQGLDRFVQFFGRYLGVLTLIVFMLAWVSAFYILQIFILDHLKKAAVLILLGAKRSFAAAIYVLQVLVVGFASLAAAAGAAALVLRVIGLLFRDRLPADLELSIHGSDLLRLLLIALASSVAFNIPLLLKLNRLQPRVLLGEGSLTADKGEARVAEWILIYAPMIAVFLALAVWLMSSWRQGAGLLGGLLVAAVVAWAAGRFFFRGLFALWRLRQGTWRLAITNLARGRVGTILCFLVLIFVALILNLVPHLLASVDGEIRPMAEKDLPAFFLFNIPEGSVDNLKQFTEENGAELRYLSPFILARFEKVNGKPPESEFLRKFPVRISFREKMIPSETIVAGRVFPPRFQAEGPDSVPQISMEKGFAERNGYHVGDLLEFDVQGVPISGRVVNIRRVRWTDFHPNFFMEFQGGVLDDAPKSFIANINLADPSRKAALQSALIQKFPDVSVIDIGRTVTRIFEISDAMTGPIRQIAWLAVGMSILVFLVIVGHNLRLRRGEIDIMKILGAEAATIRFIIVAEYAMLALFAALAGSAFGILLAQAIAVRFLDITLRLSYGAAVGSAVFLVLVSILIARLSCNRVLASAGFRINGA